MHDVEQSESSIVQPLPVCMYLYDKDCTRIIGRALNWLAHNVSAHIQVRSKRLWKSGQPILCPQCRSLFFVLLLLFAGLLLCYCWIFALFFAFLLGVSAALFATLLSVSHVLIVTVRQRSSIESSEQTGTMNTCETDKSVEESTADTPNRSEKQNSKTSYLELCTYSAALPA